jgi:hypothetical protein
MCMVDEILPLSVFLIFDIAVLFGMLQLTKLPMTVFGHLIFWLR